MDTLKAKCSNIFNNKIKITPLCFYYDFSASGALEIDCVYSILKFDWILVLAFYHKYSNHLRGCLLFLHCFDNDEGEVVSLASFLTSITVMLDQIALLLRPFTVKIAYALTFIIDNFIDDF